MPSPAYHSPSPSPSLTLPAVPSGYRWVGALALLWLLLCAGWLVPTTKVYAQPVTLAVPYHPQLDVRDYWVSEKYDGIRAHWNGRQLLSRQGLPIAAPRWFTQGWSRAPMDGELWAGRGQFSAVQSLVSQHQADDKAWRAVRYMVFDLPEHPGHFSARNQHLQQVVGALHQPWVQATPQWRVDSHAALQRQLQDHVHAGAEGLMLRRENAPYRGGRSDDLVKLKPFEDAEAVVVKHLPGKGKFQNMTGALEVQMPSGQRFRLGSGLSDADRASPPPIGSTVTYRYNGLHPSGLPRFARFWRIRSEGLEQAVR